jgi:TonB family protein
MCPAVDDRLNQRRFVALLGASLVFHLALLWFVRPPAPPPRSAGIELELAWVEARPDAVEPAPTPEVSPPAARPATASAPPSAKKRPAPATTTPSGSGETGAPRATAPETGARGDLPIAARPTLTPSAGFALSLNPGVAEDTPRGTTVRNGPGEAPDQASLNEYTGEKLTRQLNSDLAQEVGLAAVAVGSVPTHFKSYESAMRSALPKAKIERTPLTAGDVVRDVASVMFNEGPSAEAARKVADSPLGRSVAAQSVMSPNVEDQRFRESALQLMSQGENLRERARRARLRTVLEMTTDASGALADVSIIERSGDPRFDESVLHFSRKVARGLPDNDEKRLGSSTWRTRWQFTWEPPEVRVKLLNAWRVSGEPSAQ